MKTATSMAVLWASALCLSAPQLVFAWDLYNAKVYAQFYCATSNPDYCNMGVDDCANFICQILTAGCQNLCEAPYWFRCGSVIDNDISCADCNGQGAFGHRTLLLVSSLRGHLGTRIAYYQLIRNPNTPNRDYWTAPMDVPSWVGEGDIILLANANFSHRHSVFVYSGNGYMVTLYNHGRHPCGSENLSSYWARYGPGGRDIDGYFDRFWIYHVIASPAAQKETIATGGIN